MIAVEEMHEGEAAEPPRKLTVTCVPFCAIAMSSYVTPPERHEPGSCDLAAHDPSPAIMPYCDALAGVNHSSKVKAAVDDNNETNVDVLRTEIARF